MRKIVTIFIALVATKNIVAQNVGIGITTPAARLHIIDSNVVFTGPATIPSSTTFNPPIQGAGTRMMWYPQKAAFRTGFVTGTHWDKDSIGNYSFASGINTKAIGLYSTAMGGGSTASNVYSLATGLLTVASGEVATSIGNKTQATGNASTAMGYETVASGQVSNAMGYQTVASGGAATTMGYQTVASGSYSTAMGWQTNSSGMLSTAMGYSSLASGSVSMAMGQSSIATGDNSTAMGFTTKASGLYSTATGAYTTASGITSTAMGSYNKARSNNTLVAGTFNDTTLTNSLFEIGNGAADNARNNAMTILLNGNTGVGTITPSARLHVADSNVVFTGPPTIGFSTTFYPPLQGPGSRTMWYPQKAAFRTGIVDGAHWDKDSIGRFSFAAGFDVKAKGEGSAAFGIFNDALGDYSTTLGIYNKAEGYASFVAGNTNRATGESSMALGYLTLASARLATAMGDSTIASAMHSTAMGYHTMAANNAATSTGYNTKAAGFASVSMGSFSKAKSDNSLAIGTYNDTTGTNRLFEIGNGTADNARSNAVTVLQNGSTGIGTISPSARLQVADSNVVFTGPASIPVSTSYNPPIEGPGTRMMWYPQKAAFRAGSVATTQWDKNNIGRYSFATGFGTIASGENSVAMGYGSVASGLYSGAIGYTSFASGNYAMAIGYSNYATGDLTTAMGAGTVASGVGSTVMGSSTKAKSDYSLVIGTYNDTTATGRLFEIGNGTGDNARSNAMTVLQNGNTGIGIDPAYKLHVGYGTLRAEGPSVAGGTAIAVGGFGDVSVDKPGIAGGRFIIKENGNVGIGNNDPLRPLTFESSAGQKIQFYQSVAGEYGMAIEGGELRIHADQPGSRVSFGTRSNAGVYTELARARQNGVHTFEVNGSLWANGITYASDERFKQNITPISSPLQKLLQIHGVEYEMKTVEFAKNNFQPGRQIGLIAQNVEKVIPEAVNEADGYKGVDYAKLVPLLVESIKEEHQQVEKLKKEVNELKQLVQQLLKNK
ncbi:MAG: tail fiber domain-containing protein [Chitinophagaceae bacterium]|nr:tail fiber domain-containing protein [Chitinophagaceae bacterium]